MNREDIPNILASIAASYTRRELDRSVYDRLMEFPIGRSLGALTRNEQYALEFLAYAASAVALRHGGEAGAVRTFLTEVAADAPSEIAKRMINGSPGFSQDDLRRVMSRLPDSDMSALAALATAAEFSEISTEDSQGPPVSQENTFFGGLADQIAEATDRRRARRDRKK